MSIPCLPCSAMTDGEILEIRRRPSKILGVRSSPSSCTSVSSFPPCRIAGDGLIWSRAVDVHRRENSFPDGLFFILFLFVVLGIFSSNI